MAAPGDDKNYFNKDNMVVQVRLRNHYKPHNDKLKELANKEPMVPDGTTCCVGGRLIDIQVVHIVVLFL